MENTTIKPVNPQCTPQMLEKITDDEHGSFKIQSAPYHEVYPNIIIGGKSTSMNKDLLAELGVSHVVNCAQGDEYGFVNTDESYYQNTSFQFHAIPAKDKIGFLILPYLKPTADYIHQALQNGGRVFVHCCSGYSRAPTIVVSYLMLYKGMDVRDALTQVRSKRRVSPNQSFRIQLCQLNAELFDKKP